MTMTHYLPELERDRNFAVDQARLGIDRMRTILSEALRELEKAAAGRPYRSGSLDLYGNAVLDVAKDLRSADVLLRVYATATLASEAGEGTGS